MNPIEVDDSLSGEERSRLRDEQQELEKLPYEERHEGLVYLYSEFIKKHFESPEHLSKKDKICMLKSVFGTHSKESAIADSVGASLQYVKEFKAFDSMSTRSSGGVTYHYDDEAHERGKQPIVLQREPRRHRSITSKTRERILDRDGHKCLRCGSTETLEIHHITPVARGGSDDKNNLATLCSECHKSAIIVGADKQVTAYPPGEFEAWLNHNLNICGSRTSNNKRCQNPAESCPHHD